MRRIQLNNKETKDFGYFTTNYRQMTFPGFLSYGKKEEDIKLEEKPAFQEEYILEECTSSEKNSPKPSLYNESAIVNCPRGDWNRETIHLREYYIDTR